MLMPGFPRFATLSDRALVVHLGDQIDMSTFRAVRSLARQLEGQPPEGMIEFVPAFTTVAIYYDPLRSSEAELAFCINDLTTRFDLSADAPPRVVEIPVCYGGEFGNDLKFVAKQANLTPEEVIEIHSAGDYLVHMIGFAPGFPYLGGMSPRIATPRRETPRVKTPAGSVGIAGEQTGVYPIETPGGWQLIGRTPLALFRPQETPPTLLLPGDTVRFAPITAQQFHDLCEYPR